VIPIYVPDTSALLKRYFDEAGSERMDELFEEASQGTLEICLIPIVRYKIIARLKRVENAIRNRSAGRLPLLRPLLLDTLRALHSCEGLIPIAKPKFTKNSS